MCPTLSWRARWILRPIEVAEGAPKLAADIDAAPVSQILGIRHAPTPGMPSATARDVASGKAAAAAPASSKRFATRMSSSVLTANLVTSGSWIRSHNLTGKQH